MSRLDARSKADGSTNFVADISVPGMLHVAVARSTFSHARLLAIQHAKYFHGRLKVDRARTRVLPFCIRWFQAFSLHE